MFGGPDGELGASLRYLSQRYSVPYRDVAGVLTDIGTEELAHMEMISAIVYQLTKDLSIDEIKAQGFDTYFVDHTTGIYPVAASGVPFTASYFQSKGDIITDLHENMAAEQKARTTYDNILMLVDDPDILDPIRFLREREIVHFQRFGEAKLTNLSRFCTKSALPTLADFWHNGARALLFHTILLFFFLCSGDKRYYYVVEFLTPFRMKLSRL